MEQERSASRCVARICGEFLSAASDSTTPSPSAAPAAVFQVEKNEKGASYDVDLAGGLQGADARAEAVVNDPMPPRLFVMARDG